MLKTTTLRRPNTTITQSTSKTGPSLTHPGSTCNSANEFEYVSELGKAGERKANQATPNSNSSDTRLLSSREKQLAFELPCPPSHLEPSGSDEPQVKPVIALNGCPVGSAALI